MLRPGQRLLAPAACLIVPPLTTGGAMADQEQRSVQERTEEVRDFFVSFNQRDRPRATWIAWVLEEKGWSTWFQDWDFRHNFVEHMNEANRRSRWTIAVLSDNYVGSEFATIEWTARLANDTKRVIPVLVGRLS